MQSKPPIISITEPKVFNTGAVAIVNGYGILMIAPIFGAILLISLMKFSILTVLIPLLALALTVYFLPFGFGNTHVVRLVRSLVPAADKAAAGVVVQLTLFPRIRKGLRAILEDADDIGRLAFTANELVFQGDSVHLSLPFDCIQRVQPQSVNLRVPFIHGWRIRVAATGLPGVEWVEFAERSSCVLPTSWAVSHGLNERLKASVTRAAAKP